MPDQPNGSASPGDREEQGLDVGTHEEFFEFYAAKGATDAYVAHAERLKEALLAAWGRVSDKDRLDVADIGCGPGVTSITWARSGHRVRGLDINRKLLDHAREQADEAGVPVRFDLGSATDLPWPDACVDICMMPELLEHVRDWQRVLQECARIVRRPGLLFLSTTNRMCPIQNEFNLPAFSWYPQPLKRHYIRLAETTRPELANYAKYPAYNWFTVADLKAALRQHGFDGFYDRFDLAAGRLGNGPKGRVVRGITRVPFARWLSQFASPTSTIAAVKRG